MAGEVDHFNARPGGLPYSVSGIGGGDPEAARALFREGGTLLLLNVPPGTLVGLDGQVSGMWSLEATRAV